MTRARAAVAREFAVPLTVEDIELRTAGPDEVLVRIDAAAVCITDVLAIGGLTFAKPPFVTGHAAAGVVEYAGERVTGLVPGTRVVVAGSAECGSCEACVAGSPSACAELMAGMVPPRYVAQDARGAEVTADGGVGAFAERMVYRPANLVPVASTLPADRLCLLGCGVTSGLGAVLSVARVRPGTSVAIVGCGHLGQWMTQAARLAGAGTIIAIDPLHARREIASVHGATHLVDPADGDIVGQVKDLTAGRGVDYGFEAAGSATAMRDAFLMTRAGGTVVPTGMETPEAEVTLPALEFSISARRVLGSQTGGGHLKRDVPRFVDLLERGRVSAEHIAGATFRLNDINEALGAARDRTALTGVMVP